MQLAVQLLINQIKSTYNTGKEVKALQGVTKLVAATFTAYTISENIQKVILVCDIWNMVTDITTWKWKGRDSLYFFPLFDWYSYLSEIFSWEMWGLLRFFRGLFLLQLNYIPRIYGYSVKYHSFCIDKIHRFWEKSVWNLDCTLYCYGKKGLRIFNRKNNNKALFQSYILQTILFSFSYRLQTSWLHISYTLLNALIKWRSCLWRTKSIINSVFFLSYTHSQYYGVR